MKQLMLVLILLLLSATFAQAQDKSIYADSLALSYEGPYLVIELTNSLEQGKSTVWRYKFRDNDEDMFFDEMLTEKEDVAGRVTKNGYFYGPAMLKKQKLAAKGQVALSENDIGAVIQSKEDATLLLFDPFARLEREFFFKLIKQFGFARKLQGEIWLNAGRPYRLSKEMRAELESIF